MYTWELDPTDPTSMLRSLCFMLVEQQLKTMAINPRCEVMKVWSVVEDINDIRAPVFKRFLKEVNHRH